MKRLLSIALIILAPLSAAACGGADKAAGPPNTLQRGISSDPETLDQHKSRSIQAADVIRDLGEGLVGYSATGELIPAAAQSWEISEDGLKYTFHLRDGLRWSNSDPITGQAAWFDLRVKIERTDAPAECDPACPPIKSPVGQGPTNLAWKVGK